MVCWWVAGSLWPQAEGWAHSQNNGLWGSSGQKNFIIFLSAEILENSKK
jgi:hypothetical protein